MAITNSDLPLILERVGGRWPNSRVQADFTPQTATLESIIKEQTADVRMFGLPDEQDLYVTWLLNCGQVPAACDTDCLHTGPSSSTFRETAKIDQCIQNTFQEPYDAWRSNEFGLKDALASQLQRLMKDHLEYVEQYSVGIINSNAGINSSVSNPLWTGTGTTVVTIPADQITSTAIFGPLMRNAVRNRFNNPYGLSGEALAQLDYLARTNSGNSEGKGDALRIQAMRMYFDYFNVDEVNDPNLDFYVIDRGTLAFASKGYFPLVGDPNNPRGAEVFSYGKMRFSVRNQWVPQLIHDVEVYDSCTSGVESTTWTVRTRYKTLSAPEGCLADNTGILRFRVGAGV
jgi:hypothetical protein